MAALTYKVGGDTSGLGRAVSRAKGMLSDLGSAAKNLALGGAVAGSVAAIGAAFRGVKLAAEMEQVSVAMEVMTGSAEKGNRAIEALMKFSDETPLSSEDVVAAGRALIAFGTDADDVVGVLRKVGNVASGIGAPIGELAEIYGKAQVSGRLFGEDINQLAGRGIPIHTELAKVLGVTSAEIKKMVTDGKIGFPELEKAFSNMSAEGGQFAGMLAKQSKTFSGLFSTLVAKLNNLLRDVGQGLMESLKPVLSKLISLVDENSAAAKRFGQTIKEAVFVIVEAFKTGVLGELLKASFLYASSFLVNSVVGGFATAGEILMKAAVGVSDIISGIFSSEKVAAFFKMMKLGAFEMFVPKQEFEPFRSMRLKKEQELIKDVTDSTDRIDGGVDAIFDEFEKGIPDLMDLDKQKDNFMNIANPLLEAVRKNFEKMSNDIAVLKTSDIGQPSRASLFGLDKNEEEKKEEKDPFTDNVLRPVLTSLGRIGGAGEGRKGGVFRMDSERNKLLKQIEFNTKNQLVAVFA